MMSVDPSGKASVAILQGNDPPRVFDDGIDLLPVSNDAGIGQQARPISFAKGGNDRGIEVREGKFEGGPLPEHDQPR